MKKALSLVFFTSSVVAAPVDWSGGGGTTTWSEGTNWLGGLAPTTNQTATFPAGPVTNKNANITTATVSAYAVDVEGDNYQIFGVSSDPSVALLTISGTAGALITVAGNGFVLGTTSVLFSNSGSISIGGGKTFQMQGSASIYGAVDMTVFNSGSLVLGGGYFGSNPFNSIGASTISLSGGAIQNQNNSFIGYGAGRINLNSATLVNNTVATFGGGSTSQIFLTVGGIFNNLGTATALSNSGSVTIGNSSSIFNGTASVFGGGAAQDISFSGASVTNVTTSQMALGSKSINVSGTTSLLNDASLFGGNNTSQVFTIAGGTLINQNGGSFSAYAGTVTMTDGDLSSDVTSQLGPAVWNVTGGTLTNGGYLFVGLWDQGIQNSSIFSESTPLLGTGTLVLNGTTVLRTTAFPLVTHVGSAPLDAIHLSGALGYTLTDVPGTLDLQDTLTSDLVISTTGVLKGTGTLIGTISNSGLIQVDGSHNIYMGTATSYPSTLSLYSTFIDNINSAPNVGSIGSGAGSITLNSYVNFINEAGASLGGGNSAQIFNIEQGSITNNGGTVGGTCSVFTLTEGVALNEALGRFGINDTDFGLFNGVQFTNTGAFAGYNCGTVTLHGATISNLAGATFGLLSGQVDLSSNTVVLNSGASFGGASTAQVLTMDSGTFTNQTNGTFSSYAGTVSQSGGLLTNDFTSVLGPCSWNITGGTLVNNGTLISGLLDVSVNNNALLGTISGTGSLVFNATATLEGSSTQSNTYIGYYLAPALTDKAGILNLIGTLSSNASISIDGQLQGTGTLIGTITNRGLVQPSNSLKLFIGTATNYPSTLSLDSSFVDNIGADSGFGYGSGSVSILDGVDFVNESGAKFGGGYPTQFFIVEGGTISNLGGQIGSNVINLSIHGGTISNESLGTIGYQSDNLFVTGGAIFNTGASIGEFSSLLDLTGGSITLAGNATWGVNATVLQFDGPFTFSNTESTVGGGSGQNILVTNGTISQTKTSGSYPTFGNGAGNLELSGSYTFLNNPGILGGANLTQTLTVSNGSISNLNLSTLAVNGGSCSFSGGTIFNDSTSLIGPAQIHLKGSEIINNGYIFAALSSGGSPTSYDPSAISTFSSGTLSGVGTLYVAGTATLTVPASQGTVGVGFGFGGGMTSVFHALGAPTIIESYASMYVNNILTSNVIISPLGMLAGTGTVIGNVDNFGSIYPGVTIGDDLTFNVQGSVTFENGSEFNVDLDGGTSDLLDVVSGNVLLTGTPDLFLHFGALPEGSYTLINITGGTLSGSQFTVHSNQPLIGYELEYLSDSLLLIPGILPFTLVATTPNTMAVANLLDSLSGHTNACLQSKIDEMLLLTLDPLQIVLNQLHPAEMKGMQVALEELTFNMNDELKPQLFTKAEGVRPFIAASYDYITQPSYSQYAGFKTYAGYQLAGLSVGKNDWQWMGALGALESSSHYKTIPAHSSSVSPVASLGACGFKNRWTFGGDILGAYHFLSTSRAIQLFGLKAHSNHEGFAVKGQLHVDYLKPLEKWNLDFYEDLGYYYGQEFGYTESGAECLSLKVDEATREMLRNALGMKFSLAKNERIHPYLDLAYVYEKRFGSKIYRATFVGNQPKMTVTGITVNHNYGRVGAGIEGHKGGLYYRFNASSQLSSGLKTYEASAYINKSF